MEEIVYLKIITIFVLLIISGFFSGSETALFSLTLIQREKLRGKKNKTSMIINELLRYPGRLITTILIGNDLINITASVLATYLLISLFGIQGKWVAIAVMTPLTMVFAEIIPKTIGIAYNEKAAPIVAPPIYFFSKIIKPVRWLFETIANLIIRLFGVDRHNPAKPIMEDDFLHMVDISHEDGGLRHSEKELIHNVFEFSDTLIKDVMTPLDQFFSLPHNISIANLIKQVKKNNFSRIPVHQNDRNNITGILYAKDLLKVDLRKLNPKTTLSPRLFRKPIFISENNKIDTLFNFLKHKRIHMAICVDSNRKVTGLITMEDLLEELFGEIYDEHDEESP
ncbi:MAG: hemolysin family protein [Proteobacteria bacterium]|nr:hemolysin family protein [Pseudomonadota bacterium]